MSVKKSKNSTPNGDYFPGISKIEYNPKAPMDDSLVFRHYNASQVVHGKTMEEWLRFSVCFWHSFRGVGLDPFGSGTITRPWDDGSDSLEAAKQRMRAGFEFFSKLGVKYWTFHDRDIAPEGNNLASTNANLDIMADLAEELMQKTGVKLLWATSNLFSNPRFMLGAATSSDARVTAYAAAQVKKCLDVAKRLGAENFVFWGGREGYNSLLNSDVKQELDHMAAFFRMVVAYKEKIGFKGQLLIEPKPKEPTRHQYDYDAQTVMAFLHEYGLSDHFKLNIEPNHTTLAGHCYEHDVVMASIYGKLGSIDANTGSPDLGWDTDQFPMDVKSATLIMKTVIEQGGLAPGGLNFDAKVRRDSNDLRDLFIGHIAAMDTFARGLINASKIIEDGHLAKSVASRYSTWAGGLGAKIAASKATLEDCEKYTLEEGHPTPVSAHQEHFEAILNNYV
ncbi:Xylose isomerase [Trinorchestia longiramus]|nr:Xylose isomerase [Trinorchestia longiramus]